MSDPAPIAEPTTTADPADDDSFYQQALRGLVAGGTKLIDELIADPTMTAAAKAEPYERYARALRRTVALARQIAENPTKNAVSAAARRAQSRRQVIREVEDAIVLHADSPERAESFHDELDERLDDPEFDRDLASRPIADIIRDLKRDFGLTGNGYDRHPRRTPAHIHYLNARAAAPTQPSATPPPDPATAAEPEDPEFEFEPGLTRSNALLARYREAADG